METVEMETVTVEMEMVTVVETEMVTEVETEMVMVMANLV